MATKTGSIKIRMYRQGIGDCFLLTIPGKGGKPFYMLIDCGVVLGTAEPVAIMTRVVADIAAVTGGRIDLLAVTHEHWDHVSGFTQAKAFSDGTLTASQVWLAWTEDPKDPLATKLREERLAAQNALRMAVNHLALRGAAEMADRVEGLVGFFGAKAGSTKEALDKVKEMAGGKPRYCHPGEPAIVLPEIPGVRFWVLGPPKEEKLIKKSNPGKGDGYGLDAGKGGRQRFLMSALTRNMGAAEASAGVDSIEEPFDAIYSIPMARAQQVPFFANRYFEDADWRRIDATWVESSETMALQLDSATNNTSLVLAIEIVSTGEVLLFPGDAQAGNWLSWQNLPNGPDLLARTIFYKTGHHGSHNATLRAKGLELMTSEKLVAMIPVDHAAAVKKGWGRMPQVELVKRLKEKTQGRVLSTDDPATERGHLGPEWKDFGDRVAVTDLYYELSFPGVWYNKKNAKAADTTGTVSAGGGGITIGAGGS